MPLAHTSCHLRCVNDVCRMCVSCPATADADVMLRFTRETLTALGSSIEGAMDGGSEDHVNAGDDGSKSVHVTPLHVDHASEGNQDTMSIGAASQSRCPEAPREQGTAGKGSELVMQVSGELDQRELLLPEQALALLESTHPSNAAASSKGSQKMQHKTSSGESIQRTPSGRFWCQRCKNVIVQKDAERSDACSGTYAFQCCCVCAVEEGWRGWAKSACPQCRDWAGKHAGSPRAQVYIRTGAHRLSKRSAGAVHCDAAALVFCSSARIPMHA